MVSYKDAGVDINEGNEFIDLIKPLVNTTRQSNVLSHLGGFSGVYDVSFLKNFKRPVLLSSTDGVGTKIEIARELKKLDTIGIDLVAMVMNDIVVQGAEPMFLLDYCATGKLDKYEMAEIVSGIVEGCKLSNCSLLGGETAEMPGVYEDGKFDLAAFGVGAAEYDELLPKKKAIKKYDVMLGIPSSGIHSNGYSLVRKIYKDHNLSLTDDLLTPTKIYANECFQTKNLVKAFVHITGGGMLENIPRVLPAKLEPAFFQWTLPELFVKLKFHGSLTYNEMMRTFNCGYGMVAILDPHNVNKFRSFVKEATIIGEIREKNNNGATVGGSFGI